MAPLRRAAGRSGGRGGGVAVALALGIAAGALVAVLHYKVHSLGAASWAAEGSGATALTGGENAARLREQLDRALAERDAAAAEAKQLRAAAGGGGGGGGAPGSCPDRHTPWAPSAERDAGDPELAAFLRKVAINNEVLVSVSNRNYAWPGGMLQLWADTARKSGVKNLMVIALDDDTAKNAESYGLPAFRMDVKIPDSQKDVGSNHAVSALKFRILQHFIKLGYAVFLSDVDIAFFKNPFDHLHRDSDVEGMSDGWDAGTAYGYNDVADDASMGWARYAHSMRVFVINSGLFYLRPTQAASDLLDRLIYRVETENGWDQAIFNECIFFPSHPDYKDPSVTRRILDYMLFMNSKVLFKHLRHQKAQFESHTPVSVHVNYHPDKFERLQAVVKRYQQGDMKALDRFPDGSQ